MSDNYFKPPVSKSQECVSCGRSCSSHYCADCLDLELKKTRMGLSTCHISPLGENFDVFSSDVVDFRSLNVPVFDFVEGYGDFISDFRDVSVPVLSQRPSVFLPARAEIWEEGSLCKVSRERVKVVSQVGGQVSEWVKGLGLVSKTSGKVKRGAIVQFSRGSRRRLMRTIAKTKREVLPVFVTLTYPDVFPEDEREWKRHLDNFGKRLLRKFPAGAFIWRLEFQPRKSGVNEGELAPHFHLLVWNVGYTQLLQWVSSAWYGVVQSGDEKHLGAGTRVEAVRSFNGIMFYASKYILKVVSQEVGQIGRYWGIVGRDNMPWSSVVIVPLSDQQAIKALRLGRKFCKLRGRSYRSLTFIIRGERMKYYVEWLE